MIEWPDWVRTLPALATPYPGGAGYLIASPHGQVVLWSFPDGAQVPRHQHGPQIGVVVAGAVELTAEGITRTVTAGESFTLGDQVPHSAHVGPGTLVVEIFADHDRHTPTPPAS
ncbi:cupin domain-containing protein [Nocardia sp. XZ_19_385]|uniref:cupin domain-containing protein n=1 Tax=Nocardia sp. XZ_19_385 TaxID=2769488 RepID=UPI00188F3A6C|nr:cupin domain-containing protein [Nocardia sp. XZ_19_385]